LRRRLRDAGRMVFWGHSVLGERLRFREG
jgi:hypothetical protein